MSATSPNGVEFFVRRAGGAVPRYRVEVVVRGFDRLPAFVTIRYHGRDGSQKVIIVPVAEGSFGAASSQVELAGIEDASEWAAWGPQAVNDATRWERSVVADSIAAAASEATRAAWRAAERSVGPDLRDVISRYLR